MKRQGKMHYNMFITPLYSLFLIKSNWHLAPVEPMQVTVSVYIGNHSSIWVRLVIACFIKNKTQRAVINILNLFIWIMI